MTGQTVAAPINAQVAATVLSPAEASHIADDKTLILIVNVDLLTTRIISAVLEENGYQTFHQPDIRVAHVMLKQGNFSLLILMCRKLADDCLKLCNECLSFCEPIERDLKTPIVVIGRADSSEIKTHVRHAGATDYITWPVEPAELLARVWAVLRISNKATLSRSLREIVPGIELDTDRQAVILQGREKRLSAIEFRLLCYLVLHSDRICSRDELMQAVWGWADASNYREVDVYICYLRKKLEEDPRAPRHLRTVRAIGYIFET